MPEIKSYLGQYFATGVFFFLFFRESVESTESGEYYLHLGKIRVGLRSSSIRFNRLTIHTKCSFRFDCLVKQ